MSLSLVESSKAPTTNSFGSLAYPSHSTAFLAIRKYPQVWSADSLSMRKKKVYITFNSKYLKFKKNQFLLKEMRNFP